MRISITLVKRFHSQDEIHERFGSHVDHNDDSVRRFGAWETDDGKFACFNYVGDRKEVDHLLDAAAYPIVLEWEASEREEKRGGPVLSVDDYTTLIQECRDDDEPVTIRSLIVDGPQPD